ncbi:MAG: acyl-CoA dehydrogenase family protein [bacterium]|nr:acyl-CoA dehydrogenase family protein [bacterium]
MTHKIDTELLAVASSLGPLIAEHSAAGEQNRRVPQVVMKAIKEAGLVRMVTPKSLGGLETDPMTCARVVEEVSRFDSATGWTLQAANSGDFYCAHLPNEGAQEIYTNGPDTVIALAIHPPMEAIPVDGGYRVSGQNPLGSNISDADWLMTLVQSPGVDGLRGAFIAKKDLTVVDTWYTMGMRGTDSNDVAVKEVFVPTARTWPLEPVFEPGSHFQGPLYAYPSLGEGIFILAPVGLGIATQAIDEFKRLAQGKTPFMSATSLRERPVAQMALGKAEGVLCSARSFFYETVAEAWERTASGQASTKEEKAKLMLAAVHLMQSSVDAVDHVSVAAGTSGIYARSPIERAFRDIHTVRHHGWVSESRYGTYSQVVLGLEPDFPLATFGPVADGE